MASLLQMGSPLIYRNSLVKRIQRPRSFTCTIVAKTTRADESPVVLRRSANYQPSLWDHHHLLSVENKYTKDESVHERDLLKENVRKMLNDERTTHLEQLELIDDLQKLGVSYHFEREIDNILTFTYHKDRRNFVEYDMEYDLHATALEFRLLRQHGFNVPEDVFDVFMENCGKFDSHDINGLLSLYEASYLSTKSDTKLQKNVRVFATQQLKNFVDTHGSKDLASCDVEMVVQALDMPYHWRMGRLATRWYIDMYGKRLHKNPMLLEFSKLDFNIVQAVYQEELKYVSSWWRETGLANQLHFSRDRIVENYFWTTGQIQEPQFGNVRRIITKVNALLTTIDDIYDIYGTLEELQLFTAAFENWDVNRLDDLPEYMRLCFLVVYNEVNNIGCDILRNKDINVIPFLKKSDEMARGDVLKSIQCYMNETGVSEEKARMHVHKMINDMWDEMNYEKIENHSSLIPQDFAETVINLARMSQCMYQYGDGHGCPEKSKVIDRVMSVLFSPIPLD
uniref:Uncharacterized protein n=1 Tax=Brassica campestris TaxID=3711 RepID=M4C949_BRACM